MASIFVTGFPGFLGSALLPQLLHREQKRVKCKCLVQPRYMDLARKKAEEIEALDERNAGRIVLLEGDITQHDLGLGDAKAIARDVRQVFHLAAVYDLSVQRSLGLKLNLDGTRHVLEFLKLAPRFERLHYISTCYVSGRYPGAFSESDLEVGQTFNNYYEETKFLAEREVRLAMQQGLPATIYRPSIVVGDSESGRTEKYDGPYHAIQWILRQGSIAVMPVAGNPLKIRVNIVPSDFVIRALSYLSGLEESVGKTYQLCDPKPQKVDTILNLIAQAAGKKLVKVPLPVFAAKAAIDHVPGVDALLRIPSASVDYFNHPTYYTCENTLTDLRGSGIHCPPLPTYINKIVSFMKKHPDLSSKAMV